MEWLGKPVPTGEHTLNKPPMIERIMMAKTETTTLLVECNDQRYSRINGTVGGGRSSPAPGVEGGNDGLHGDESIDDGRGGR